ncbi:hypothetical protein [Caulobacter hibisci]|uniref:Uracil-DNA glycosylase n=1 Tax=Caulobacter hibisci TaxID=2035993 RepID=A0ABS0SXV3_9CAUL|nr:hypothetical protein [Caulobacter hibisci]MBI1684455.1 hypothetical protein [Caulobacter hibisci]
MSRKSPPKPTAPRTAPEPALAGCVTCRFAVWTDQQARGVCKRFPPTPIAGAGNLQPSVTALDACGEHRP